MLNWEFVWIEACFALRQGKILLGLLSCLPLLADDADKEIPDYRFPREQRDIELKEVMPSLRLGAQLGATYEEERIQDLTTEDSALDGVELELVVDLFERLSLHALMNYEFRGTKRFEFEEAFVAYALNEEGFWQIEAGRMEMPFGEYNSNFIEDPATQVIGETYDGGLMVGYETDGFEGSLAGFKGDFASRTLMAALRKTLVEGVEAGIGWTENVGESLELREMLAEAREEEVESKLGRERVPGFTAFLAGQFDRLMLDFEFHCALREFSAGSLDETPLRPQAWDLEVAYRLAERWQMATRYEASRELPDSPKRQYGIALSYGFTPNFILTTNYLRGEFTEDPARRTLLQLELVWEY